MTRQKLNWARSRWAGGISELAVLSPIIRGRVPGERRTYEERLRSVLSGLEARDDAGVPTALNKMSTIHFGRVMIIRPEQYLTHSKINLDGAYYPPEKGKDFAKGDPSAVHENVHIPIDQYEEYDPSTRAAHRRPANPARNPYEFHSWVMTQVIFDGDPVTYLREIAEFIEKDFDRVFENCIGYPMARDFEPFWAWIRRYQIPTDLFYTPYPDLSVARIKQLQEFKDRFDEFVDMVRSPTGKKVASMDELFDQFLRDNQQFARNFPSTGGIYHSKKCD